jgi:hypothetical protein
MSFTHAADALLLPSALLTADEWKMVDKELTEIDRQIRDKARRNGLVITSKCNTAVVIHEICVQLLEAGYDPQPHAIPGRPRFQGGEVPIEGYTIVINYSKAAEAEAREARLRTRPSTLLTP